jgi:hypothetical protein
MAGLAWLDQLEACSSTTFVPGERAGDTHTLCDCPRAARVLTRVGRCRCPGPPSGARRASVHVRVRVRVGGAVSHAHVVHDVEAEDEGERGGGDGGEAEAGDGALGEAVLCLQRPCRAVDADGDAARGGLRRQ